MSDAAALFSDGKAYERLMGRWSQRAGAQFLDWLNPPRGLRWIDVGCGNGAFTEVLIARAAPAAVTGIDVSEGQLAYARTRPGTKAAEFRIADAQSLPFADNSFEAASMALVIVFVSDPLQAVREMARVVNAGGTVATYMWDFPNGGFPLGPLIQGVKALGIAPSAASNAEASRMEAMRGVWEQAGVQAVETCVIRVPIGFTSFDDYWASNTVPMGTYGTAIAAMSASERERLKDYLRKTLPIAADGSITYEAFANAVKGRVPE